MRIAVVANSGWYLFNFRVNLMRALKDAGHEVVAVSPPDEHAGRLQALGFTHRPLALQASGTNPLRELATVWRLRRLLARERVDVAFTYTPKPNIYTGLAARGMRLVHVPNVSGLGRVFIQPSALTPLVRVLYRFAFRRARAIVFQNEDDRGVFVRSGLADQDRTLRVPGSGVDLERFVPGAAASLEASPGGEIVFLLVARLLWDKGVGEFVAAARSIRAEHPHVRFRLLGAATADNPAMIPRETLQGWLDEGLVTHVDRVDDVRPHLAAAHCVVLPSYREGVPRSLLEAAAMGKPLIATDVPGCRDVVDEGVNGFLCAAKDPESLARAMRRVIAMDPAEREALGARGRRKVESQFDERQVLATYLALLPA